MTNKIASLFLLLLSVAWAQNPQTAVFPAATATDADLPPTVNGGSSTLTANLLIGDTTATVADGTKFKQWGIVTIEGGTVNAEWSQVCLISGNTLTFGRSAGACGNVAGRGLDGSARVAHSSGASVANYPVSLNLNQMAAEIKALEAGDFGTRTVKGASFQGTGAGPTAIDVVEGAAPSAPSGGLTQRIYVDSTSHTLTFKDTSNGVHRLMESVASGTLALATSAIASGACQAVTQGSVNSAAATGVLTTDVIQVTPNGSIKAVTGYAPATAGGLSIVAYPTAGYVNVDVCNWSNASITPGAVSLNWRVTR